MQSVEILTQQILALNPVDKAMILEAILKSLDKPDIDIDEIWVQEAEKRYEAYKRGKLKTVSWETIQERYQ